MICHRSFQIAVAYFLSTAAILSISSGRDVININYKRLLYKSDDLSHVSNDGIKYFNVCSQKELQIVGHHVNAKGLMDSPNTGLILKTAEHVNKYGFNIISLANKRYLCFNKKSKLISRISGNSKRCIFREEYSPGFMYMMLRAVYYDWYVGFNKKGRPIHGSEFAKASHKEQRCFFFNKRNNPYMNLHVDRPGPKIKYPNKLAHLLKEYPQYHNQRDNFFNNTSKKLNPCC